MSDPADAAGKFSRELRFLICRWIDQSDISLLDVIAILELHQHEIMSRRFKHIEAGEKNPPPGPAGG